MNCRFLFTSSLKRTDLPHSFPICPIQRTGSIYAARFPSTTSGNPASTRMTEKRWCGSALRSHTPGCSRHLRKTGWTWTSPFFSPRSIWPPGCLSRKRCSTRRCSRRTGGWCCLRRRFIYAPGTSGLSARPSPRKAGSSCWGMRSSRWNLFCGA